MNNKSKKRPAAKKRAAPIESGKASNDSPAIVVGVGSSTGGTKSLKQFFANMPAGRGAAFILVQYSERQRGNLTVKLFKDKTTLAVVEAKDGVTVLADHIYIIPPDKFLSISAGKLTLQEPVLCNGLRMPIDHFFCSLALDQRHRSIGVLLSGKASDGTLGLSEIKAAGGRTFAEDPASAAYPGMPQSAIDAGVAGEVKPAEALAEAVIEIAGQLSTESRELAEQPGTDADLRAVLDILRVKVGHDFRCYKPSTIIRRIKRRMSLAKITSLDVYARFLREHPEEVGLLQKDLLIGVTDFFRQPQAWETLEDKVIASIVEGAQPGSEIRVWVPGCSTGKEAYSLAMVLSEHVEKSGKKVTVQIFATDSDLASLATARSGVYPKEDFGDNVSPERLKRFFVRKDGRYQLAKNLRERVVFAPQNITADPPFSRLDLISCRNLLIYLDQEVQKKIIALFHFALREGGFLFLGTAETVGDREELFEPVSKKWRIYRRIGVGRRVGVEIPVRPTAPPLPEDYVEAARTFAKAPPATPPSRMSLTSGAQHMLLDRFAPACVMIDRKLQVLYVHGSVEDYLTFPPGELTTRVVDMAREGLRARLRGAIAKCLQSNKSISVTARVRRGDKSFAVRTVVSPLRYPREIDGLLLITFEDYRIPVAKTSRDAVVTGDVRHLEDELKITREELQSTIEQLENSNDELKASNEEVTAANEELQSANEELETSKEELQSLNEELNTINVRLHEKVDELEGVNNDVVNLLSSTSIATVFLDRELKVKRYTPASTRLMSLIPTDTGRHIADILRRFSDETLINDARLVLADLTPLSQDVQADDGRWYIRRITPYRTQDDRIEGVVITFVDVADLKEAEEALRNDITERKRVEEALSESQHRLAVIVDSIADGFYALDKEWRFTHVNDAALRHMGKTREVILGRTLFDIYPEARGSIVANEYGSAMESGEPRHFENPSLVTDQILEIHAYPGPENLTVLFRDITEKHRMATALREAHERAEWLARFPEENPNPVMRASANGRVLYCNPASVEIPGWFCEVGQQLPEPLLPLIGQATAAGQEIQQDVELGDRFYSVNVVPIPEEGYANVYGRDITVRKQAEEALSRSQKTFFELVERSPFGTYIVDSQFRIALMNAASQDGAFRNVQPVIGRPFDEAMHILWPEPVAVEIITNFRHTLETGEPYYSRDFINPRHDAEIVEAYEWELHRMTLPDGQYGVICYYFDSTKLREAEEELRRREREFAAMFEQSSVGMSQSDPLTSRMLLVNQTFADMLGYSREEMARMTFIDITHPEDRERDLAGYAPVRTGDANRWEIEKRYLKKDGAVLWAHVSGSLIRHDDGHPAYTIAVIQDITERKQAEDALRESEDGFRTIAETLPVLVSITDAADSSVLFTNKAHNEAFGYRKEEILGLKGPDYFSDQADRVKLLEAVRERGFVENLPVKAKRKDGSVFWILASVRPISYNGKPAVISASIDNTKLKQAEEALRQSEARWNAAIENFGEGAIIATEAEQVIYWNPAARAMHGFTGAEEGIGPLRDTPITFQLWTPDGQHLLELDEWPMRRIKRGETVHHLELRLQRPDQGWEKIVSYSGAIVETASGERLIFLSVYDLTELRKAEEALGESEERYRHLVKYAPTGIYDIDYATGRFTEVNDAMCLMLGYTRDEILAMTAFDILADEGKALLASRIRLGQSGEGLSEAVEYTVRTKDGRLIWALLNTMFHRIDGRIIKATVIASDITERKQAEEELRTALQRLHALFAGMQSSLLLVGEGRIEMANQAFCDYFGLEDAPGDLVGLTPRQLIDKIKDAYLHPDEQVKRIWEIARGGQPVIGEEISMRDGRTSLRDFIPIYADGKSYGLLWHHIDITKLKQAEQILRERTAELEVANKELESFSYSVSHDLRAPLRAIDGYARMILKKEGDKFDEETMRKFNVIRSSSQMMGQLIDDILTLSRVVKKHLSTAQLEVDAVIREVWKEIETINPERNIKLTVRDVPAAYGDRTLIKQVYANLLSNAAKFTKGRDPALIETGGYIEGNENVYYVKDNGVGFEMEYYDKLFGIFQRLHKPEDFEGTGVGLATVERIVQRHGGRVWAEGKVNEGATFYFTLPQRR